MFTFEKLWRAYPSDDPCIDARGDVPKGYTNQCAIRLSYALDKCGVSFKSFHGGVCPTSTKGTSWAAGAQALANWLKMRPFPGCPKHESYTGNTLFDRIEDRCGIVFLANYWQREGEQGAHRSGDHIDLWNGSRFTAYSSWARVHFGISWDGLWSDYRRATNAMFWPIP